MGQREIVSEPLKQYIFSFVLLDLPVTWRCGKLARLAPAQRDARAPTSELEVLSLLEHHSAVVLTSSSLFLDLTSAN